MKAGILCVCIAIVGGMIYFRAPLWQLTAKLTGFSARYELTDGMLWKTTTQKGQPIPQNSPLIYSVKEPKEEEEPFPPTPPEGVETGTVKTQTLPLSAANTVEGGVHISNKTGLTVDLATYLQQGLPFTLQDTHQPQVLIVHTHATEGYLDGDYGYYLTAASTRTTNNTKNTVRVGEELARALNQLGIVTIQDTTQHDYPDYNGSYTRSAQTMEDYLEKYPSIQVVIDLHRDAIEGDDGVKIKPTATVGGKKAAQIMILAGCQTGSVEGFPNWEENFRFCLQLQRQLEADYGNLVRPLLFKACKYNFPLSTGSILIEMGTDANTLEEALYSANLLAQALGKVLR